MTTGQLNVIRKAYELLANHYSYDEHYDSAMDAGCKPDTLCQMLEDVINHEAKSQ